MISHIVEEHKFQQLSPDSDGLALDFCSLIVPLGNDSHACLELARLAARGFEADPESQRTEERWAWSSEFLRIRQRWTLLGTRPSLLGAPGIATRSKDATRGSSPHYWEQGRYERNFFARATQHQHDQNGC